MPAFPFLPDEDVQRVVDYVIMLSYRGETESRISQIAELDYLPEDEIDPFEFVDTVLGIHDQWEQAEIPSGSARDCTAEVRRRHDSSWA